jgi:hypothetical protein
MLNPFAPAWFPRGSGANQAVSLTSSSHPHEPELLSSNIHNKIIAQTQNTSTTQQPLLNLFVG